MLIPVAIAVASAVVAVVVVAATCLTAKVQPGGFSLVTVALGAGFIGFATGLHFFGPGGF